MKTVQKFFTYLTLMLLTSSMLSAQFDDVYYDPDRQTEKTTKYSEDNSNNSTTTKSIDNYNYDNRDDQSYSFDNDGYDDYDYYYSSRIRRFNGHHNGFGYYDPYYVDINQYDYVDALFWGVDIYSFNNPYNDYWRWRSWNRYNRWQAYTYWNHWDWCYGNSPYTMSYRYYQQPYFSWGYYGGNYYYGNGYYGNGYCGNYYSNNYYNNNGWRERDRDYSNNPKGTHYGSRHNGFSQTSNNGPSKVKSPRFTPPVNDKFTPVENRKERTVYDVDHGRQVDNPSPRPSPKNRVEGVEVTPSSPSPNPNPRPNRSGVEGVEVSPSSPSTNPSPRPNRGGMEKSDVVPAPKRFEDRQQPSETRPSEVRPRMERIESTPNRNESPRPNRSFDNMPGNNGQMNNTPAPRIEESRSPRGEGGVSPRVDRPRIEAREGRSAESRESVTRDNAPSRSEFKSERKSESRSFEPRSSNRSESRSESRSSSSGSSESRSSSRKSPR